MNKEILLHGLKSDSSIQRIRAARKLGQHLDLLNIEDIQVVYDKEEVPWVRKALADIITKLSGPEELTENINEPPLLPSGTLDEFEAIQSNSINETIGQILHEIEPIVGEIKLSAREEVNEYNGSKLKRGIEKLDSVLDTFDNWRKVEQEPRFSSVNIYDLISKEARDLGVPDVGVEIQLPKDLTFDTDRSFLRIVISNALRNAIESSETIDVEERLPIVIRGGISERSFWCSIIDRGRGIPTNGAPIFKSRQTTKPGHRGMGLPIVDKAINSLGGTWDLKNGAAGGAEFFLEIERRLTE